MTDYKKLKIWNAGMEIVKKVYQYISAFPDGERFGLISQMSRAAVSIPSNIAEGASRTSWKSYVQFLEISLGSCYELETQTLISIDLKLGQEELGKEIVNELVIEQKRITQLIKSIKHNQLAKSKVQQPGTRNQ